ncbi:MAG: spermidine synthase, partial [Chloroflexi bacterium]|nr:spermidine synthase [Chloroflexota bacterium]
MSAATPAQPVPEPRTLFVRNGRSIVFRPLSGFGMRLWLTSTTLLFVELMLIRWVPAEVRYIGFFSNFLLMASFLGIGLGILLGRRGARWSLVAFPLLLMAVVLIITVNQLNIEVQGGSGEIWFGLTDAAKSAADTNYTVLILAVVMVTAVMAALAMPLGPLLKSMPPLKAYAIDIVGSMTGIAAFAVMSALGTTPTVWFGIVAILVVLLVLGTRIDAWALVTVVTVLAILLPVARSNPSDTWSPYYRISRFTDTGGMINLNVNGIPHQGLHCVACPKEPFYEQVYQWFPDQQYKDVLIVGAGSGSDVALALARNDDVIERIDAVEIDPKIQQIGVEEHPDRPYQDPRVHRYINDGRAFLRSTDKKYDLVVFALPDSLTLVSQAANVRLESFLFTEEAFKSVAEHLADDGIFVLYNYYRDPWLVAKIATMLQDAFGGTPPLVRTYSDVMATIANGPLVASLNGQPPPGGSVDAIPDVGLPTPQVATDDWPFLYLRTGFVADYYLVALAIILIGALFAVG